MSQIKTGKQLGNLQFKNKNYTKAIQHYRAYIETEHDDNIQALSNISLCYYKLQQFQQAIEACDEALSIDEKYAKCYFRRAICRKQLLARYPDDKVQKYKIYYDTQMFRKFYDPTETSKDIEDLFKLSLQMYQQLVNSQPIKISPFERGLMELQKDNVSSLALSWLDSRNTAIKQSIQQKQQYKINLLYKELVDSKYAVHDQKQKQQLTAHIINKIKLMRQTKKQKQIVLDNSTQNRMPEQKQMEQQTVKQQAKQQNNQKSIQKNIQTSTKIIEQQKELNNPTLQELPQKKVQNQKLIQTKQAKEQVKKSQKQVTKQKSEEPTKDNFKNNVKQKDNTRLSNLSATQLYKQYFGSSLTNSRDVFIQFPANLIEVIGNQNVQLATKEQLLRMVANKFGSFKFHIKNIPNEWKAKITQIFTISSIPQDIKSLYINKTQ